MQNLKRSHRFRRIAGIISLVLLLLSGWLFVTAAATRTVACESTSLQKMPIEGDGIVFIEDNWQQAMQEAKKTGKPIFVDVYADWCGPCRELKKTTFKDPAAAAFFNDHFINISVNVEKGQGPELGAQWSIQALPTLLIVDSAGRVLSQSVGYLSAKQLLHWGGQSTNSKHR